MTQNLEAQINETRERLARIRRDIKAPLEADSSEQALQLENRQVLMELEKVESLKLASLEAQAKNS
ncbi:MAG: hypothetical protein K2P81_10030 [Bacteriovoracaceae bacterium]|nr:hypothetical protein [Bacteriovoracaceae bacterium]